MIKKFKNLTPDIDESVFIAEGCFIIGDVKIGKNSSVWYNTVIRGDIDRITIGENTNIQDGSVLHCITGVEVNIGNNVIVGHNSILHSCNVGDGSLIGMGSVILDRVKIGENCLIGAGTVVPPDKIIPDCSLIFGNPAKIIRKLTDEEIKKFQSGVETYLNLAEIYKD
jgi:carbonic anhydrase/acetyltransferase-like protein (isoleucine patch superfamily)